MIFFLVFLAVWVLFLFEQVKEWLLLKLHKMMRVPHVAAYPVAFNMLCDRDQKGGLLKLIKNDQILEFLDV